MTPTTSSSMPSAQASATYQRILVPLDGSELAARALPHAEAIAQAAGAQLLLLQVVPDAAMIAAESPMPSAGIPPLEPMFNVAQLQELQKDWLDQSRTAMQEVSDEVSSRTNLSVENLTLIGSPADVIVETARSRQADMIVMSTHGRSGVARWVYGSVAARVLHDATCPVLLIRAHS